MSTGTVTYTICDKYFDCGTVKELIDCTTSSIYYVDDLLLSGNTPITTGTTFVGNFNFSAGTSGLTAVTYVRELQGSSTITINGIVSQLVDCSGVFTITITNTNKYDNTYGNSNTYIIITCKYFICFLSMYR